MKASRSIPEQPPERVQFWIGVALFLAFLPALGMLPYHVAAAGSQSASALFGYSNSTAYWATAVLTLVALAACAATQHRRSGGASIAPTPVVLAGEEQPRHAVKPFELLVIGLAALVCYCPFFLARYGPYREDNYFLSVLQRMTAGQKPYVDFESLYGPLMLYLPYWWSRWFGYSMTAYFGLIALLEASLYVILLAIVQRYVRGTLARAAVFIVMSIFLFDVLLGLSWNGFRRMLPVFALLLVARRPYSPRTVLSTGLLIGIAAAYSHDFGALALVSVGAIYGLMLLRNPTWRRVIVPLVVAALAVTTWFVCCLIILGPSFPSYIDQVIYGTQRYANEASFSFFWTGHALATFAFFTIAIVAVGTGLGRRGRGPLSEGDRFMFGAFAYALLAFRGGLIRVDMWHITTPMLPLVLAFMLPWKRDVFRVPRGARLAALGLIMTMTATYLAGLAPPTQYILSGLVRGARDVFTGRTFTGEVVTRTLSIEGERTEPEEAFLALGRYLAQPERKDRPVVPYSTLWHIDKRAGFLKTTFPSDDFLLYEARGEDVRRYLETHADAFVIVRNDEYLGLVAGMRGEEPPVNRVFQPSTMKRLLTWLSTTEYVEAEGEQLQKTRRWEQVIGRYVIANYRVVAQFDALVVMARE